MNRNPRLIDMTSMRFGEWTVVSKAGNKKGGAAIWNVQCACGSIGVVAGTDLRNGKSVSCGCKGSRRKIGVLSRTHGRSDSKLYTTWQNMRSRCNYIKNDHFPNYGGRGIKVCDEWNDFSNFAEWADRTGYQPSLTIERVDVDGDYAPNNCRWIPAAEQARNKTVTPRNAEGTPWIDVAEANGVLARVFRCRVSAGKWPPEIAATWPVGKRRMQRERDESGRYASEPSKWRR